MDYNIVGRGGWCENKIFRAVGPGETSGENNENNITKTMCLEWLILITNVFKHAEVCAQSHLWLADAVDFMSGLKGTLLQY